MLFQTEGGSKLWNTLSFKVLFASVVVDSEQFVINQTYSQNLKSFWTQIRVF
jgi:hypothetical protein